MAALAHCAERSCTAVYRWPLLEADLAVSDCKTDFVVLGFIAGMFIVVRAIEDTGLTTLFGNWLVRLSGGTSFGAVIVGTVGAALGTNLINNRTDGCGDDLCFGRYPARIAGDPTRIRRSYDAAAQGTPESASEKRHQRVPELCQGGSISLRRDRHRLA